MKKSSWTLSSLVPAGGRPCPLREKPAALLALPRCTWSSLRLVCLILLYWYTWVVSLANLVIREVQSTCLVPGQKFIHPNRQMDCKNLLCATCLTDCFNFWCCIPRLFTSALLCNSAHPSHRQLLCPVNCSEGGCFCLVRSERIKWDRSLCIWGVGFIF